MDFILERLDAGVLYISRRYHTASHLCCCGCGHEVVTPLNEAKWQLSDREGEIWLRPSIGNWSFPCQSHYWLEGGKVRWSVAMSASDIAAVRRRDRLDAEQLTAQTRAVGPLRRIASAVWDWLASLFRRGG